MARAAVEFDGLPPELVETVSGMLPLESKLALRATAKTAQTASESIVQ